MKLRIQITSKAPGDYYRESPLWAIGDDGALSRDDALALSDWIANHYNYGDGLNVIHEKDIRKYRLNKGTDDFEGVVVDWIHAEDDAAAREEAVRRLIRRHTTKSEVGGPGSYRLFESLPGEDRNVCVWDWDSNDKITLLWSSTERPAETGANL